MNPDPRPADAAPGGMRGATRMHDPTEAAHDRARRWLMNLAFVMIVVANIVQWKLVGIHGWREWLSVLLLAVAALPLALAVKVFELRFKMAAPERQLALRELPAKRQWSFAVQAILCLVVFCLNAPRLSWALLGIWLYDFVTYYHDRPERLRHLYAITKTLDELRRFPAPWVWPLPAVVWALVQLLL